MRTFIERQLALFSKRVLRREKPQIIAITGSVGKSSAKQAVGAVLGDKFKARVSPKNYNTEIGVPLSVLGLHSGESSAVGWIQALWKGFLISVIKQKDYPAVLVLEMAADKKGDIKRLVSLAKPNFGVVTTVGESHTEFLGSAKEIAKEKKVLVDAVDNTGIVILNRDDELVWAMREGAKAKVVSFGFHEEADVRAFEESMNFTCDPTGKCGMSFKVSAGGSTVPIFLPYVLGRHAIYAALIATAIGVEKGMNLVEIADRFSEYKAPPGRMRFIVGIKNTVLIDDSYNSAPQSALAALAALHTMPIAEENTKFAVLGDMLELGQIAEEAHRELGRRVAESNVDVLVMVGELMNDTKQAALDAGMSKDKVFHFSTTEEAGRFVQDRMKQGDIVLVKGSRGMHMEYVVKELMADPVHAATLLAGEHDEWRM